ncbi:MAG: AAA family ATPase [Rubrivivax sp.]|nr:AAA family ATPase [Rubrivivax sp.]
MYELTLLGPVTLRRQGAAVPLATAKLAALLVLLALGGPAHRARLAGWLWPNVDDAAARRNLRRELARLREAGVGDVLASEGDVLALAGAPRLACDAWTFRDGAASPHERDVDAALALWRGPPADGLALGGTASFDDWLQAEREQLHALRRRALQASAAAHEARGGLDAALARIEALLADDPLQEHLHREAMRLHLAAGRREAALAQYKRCRELLQRELGLAPMAATEALAQQAARAASAPSSLATPAAGAGAAAGQPVEWPAELPLTGRDEAWAALQAAWDRHRVMLVEGEAGTGKTRLAGDFAAAQGAYALAQCRAGDAEIPYAAFKRALRLLAGPSLAAAGLPAWVGAELAHVLPELGEAAPRTATAEDRSRLHEAAIAAWQALAAGSFDSIVIDDWHLADADSRTLLATIALAPPAADAPRLIVLLRPELDGDARAMLHTLAAAGALHLRLAPLDGAQLLELVRRVSGAGEAQRFSQRLLQATGGNPFFVAETLRHWQALGLLARGADGVWRTPFDDATTDYRELPLPASVRDAVLTRVARQAPAARRLLEAAALATEPFTPSLLAGACALSELEALDAIDQALAAGLLRELGGGYAFAHDLVQSALESTLTPERRRLVHRRLALGAQAAALAPAEIARHWEDGGEPRRAVPQRLAAAAQALALGSHDSAEQHWQAALADGPDAAQHLALLRQRWPLLRSRDDRPGLQALAAELAQLAGQWSPQPDTAAAAREAHVEQAMVCTLLNRGDDALALTDATLAALAADDPLRARALLVRAQALNLLGRIDDAEAAAEQALAGPGGAALPPTLQAQLLHTLAYSHYVRAQPQRALPFAQRALAVWQGIGDRRMVARGLANLGAMRGAAGDGDSGDRDLEQALAIATELRLVPLQRELSNNIAYRHLQRGEPERALALTGQALALSPHFARPAFRVYLRAMRVQALWQLGELGAALDLADEALPLARDDADKDPLLDLVSMTLDVHGFIGDFDGAERLLAEADARGGGAGGWLAAKLAFNRCRLALERGDAAAAGAVLAPAADPQALRDPRDRDQARLCRAELALAAGDPATARRWLAEGLEPRAAMEARARHALLRLAAWPGDGAEGRAARDGARDRAADARTPRPLVMLLQQALAAQAAAAGDEHLAAEAGAAFEALRQHLADSLAARPALRDRLLARWR